MKVDDHIPINVNHILFYGKVLAINSFRIPKVMKLISATTSLHDEEFHLISKSLNPQLFSFIDDMITNNNNDNNRENTNSASSLTDGRSEKNDNHHQHQIGNERQNGDKPNEESQLKQIPLPEDDPTSLSHLIDETPDIEISTATLINEHIHELEENNNGGSGSDKTLENGDDLQTKGDFKFESNDSNDNSDDSPTLSGGLSSLSISDSKSQTSSMSDPLLNTSNFQSLPPSPLHHPNNHHQSTSDSSSSSDNNSSSKKESEEEILTKRQLQQAQEFERLCKMIDLYPSLFAWSQVSLLLLTLHLIHPISFAVIPTATSGDDGC